MSDQSVFTRRDFLKLVGIGVAGATSGCAKPPADKLIPYLVPPKDVLPGIPMWFASTCRECPAGCGVLVKTREGRTIKIEGNPEHPVNRGRLCARGQAGLQGLYDPDRVASPMLKQGTAWKKLSWEEALKLAGEKIGDARRNRRGIALITDHAPGSFEKLAQQWAAAAGGTYLAYEPFAHHALREANRRTFGQASVPYYDFGRARFVISFGADFLETWISPVDFARGFAELRARREEGATFVAVEPRLSLTGSNADEWLAVRPGGELAVALGMAQVILAEGLGASVPERAALADAVASYNPEAVESRTEIPADVIRRLARSFAAKRPSLAVAGGIASQSEQTVAMLAAVNLLNYVAGNVGETVRFDRILNDDAVASFSELQGLGSRMTGGEVDVLLVHAANPVYSTPAWAGFAAAIDKVAFKISLSPVLDETAERCDLLLPSSHPLESFGDSFNMRGVYSLLQPTMQRLPMFDTRAPGETLLALAGSAGFGPGFSGSWLDYLKSEWKGLHSRFGKGADFETFWTEALRKGGVWEEPAAAPVRWASTPAFATPELRGTGTLALLVYPSATLYDGRGANKSWLQELPDPTTKAVWGTWVEIHPETAKTLGIAQGDPVKIETESGSLELPAYLYAGIRKDAIAIPLGQGHTSYGRYAQGRGANACVLLPPAQDTASLAVAYLSAKARISRGAGSPELVVAQIEKQQMGRDFAQIVPLATLLAGGAAGSGSHGGGTGAAVAHGGAASHAGGAVAAAEGAHHEVLESQTRAGVDTEPRQLKPGEKLPAHVVTAYEPEEEVRHPRAIPITQGIYAHGQHRWAMAIDLNSCTGCSACVAACYAENNIPVVGPQLMKNGREMAWIRIERFEESLGPGAKSDVRHLPMLCQHCGDAPCEIVCPVYATYHNPEGLNTQIYNRCVGTRYCSNNCPYKVRAFNWFDYTAPEKATFAFPEPLNWQLNPDVTVRSKGVMEKCTMCVQRILEGKGNAKDEGRPLRDGEIKTACQQTCPTQAIVFGDLLDPQSEVSKRSHGERRYWALNELNTKPGVTYLKKIDRASEVQA